MTPRPCSQRSLPSLLLLLNDGHVVSYYGLEDAGSTEDGTQLLGLIVEAPTDFTTVGDWARFAFRDVVREVAVH